LRGAHRRRSAIGVCLGDVVRRDTVDKAGRFFNEGFYARSFFLDPRSVGLDRFGRPHLFAF
jgi:hypothetical protein